MNTTPTQNVWFDDAATSAMGEAFDNACKSLQNFGSAVPEIIANQIIAAAKVGERDAARLYEQALRVFDIDDTSTLFVSVGHDVPVPTYFGHARSVTLREPGQPPHPSSRLALWCVFKLPTHGI